MRDFVQIWTQFAAAALTKTTGAHGSPSNDAAEAAKIADMMVEHLGNRTEKIEAEYASRRS